ncbi:MAG: insulinase family protein [Burkholderiales bacterium]|nr:insulinase family protein [Burkholderiales bacterium]
MTRHFPQYSAIASLFLCSLLPAPGWAQQTAVMQKAAQQKPSNTFAADLAIPYSPKLIKGKLANGLTYYIQKNAKPEQKLELRLVVKAGSVLEDDDQQGLAHFVEHMAFNGSKHFKKNELVSFLESIGVKFGADLNAYTSFDETVYILPIPTDKPENLEKGMLVLSDWAQGLSFDDVEIDKERGVILEEARLGKGAADRIRKQILPSVLHGSRYADRLPIGKEDLLKTFKYDAVKRFYRDWYRPDLMAVVMVGDVDPAQGKALIEKTFSGLRNPDKQRARIDATIPLKNTGEALVALDKEANIASVGISQTRYLNRNDGKFGSYRERRIQSFFNVMLSNRLRELSQLPQPPFLGGSSGVSTLIGDYQEISSNAAIGKAGVQAAINALMQENKRAAQFGFSAPELERAKSNSLLAMEHSYNERDKTQSAEFAAEFIRNFLSGESIPGIEAEYEFHKKIVQGISLEEINKFAKSMLVSLSPKLIIYQGNEKADHPIPTQDELKKIVNTAGQIEVQAYTEKAVAKSLFDKAPTAATILKESKNAQLGTTEIALSNGIQVVMKPTDFKSDQILFVGTRVGGSATLGDADFLQARFATTVVGAMGVKDLAPIELSKYLAGKSASVSTTFSENSEGVSGSSNKDDLETALQVLHLAMLQPRRDEALFASFISKQSDALRNQMATPIAVFQEQFINATFPVHPRLPFVVKPEHIAQLDLDRMMAIYRARFSSAYGMKFFMVGNFDVEKVKPLLQTYLGSLPTPEINIKSIDHGLRPYSGIIKKEVYAGKEDQSIVTLQMHGERAMSEDDRLRFSAMVEVLQLRLTAKLREEMGAVYSPHVNGVLKRTPYQGHSVILALPSGPEKINALLKASFELIDQLKAAPATDDELNKVKENWLKNRRESVKTNQFWLGVLSNAYLNQDDPADIFSFEGRVKNLKGSDIQEAAQAYLDMHNYIQVIMYPESAKAGTSSATTSSK